MKKKTQKHSYYQILPKLSALELKVAELHNMCRLKTQGPNNGQS